MKRFKFPKGIKRVNFPIHLHDMSPWQDQVKAEAKKMQERYGTSKSSEWGFTIDSDFAEIYIKKI